MILLAFCGTALGLLLMYLYNCRRTNGDRDEEKDKEKEQQYQPNYWALAIILFSILLGSLHAHESGIFNIITASTSANSAATDAAIALELINSSSDITTADFTIGHPEF
jgi:hypothetical protein